MSLEQEDTEPAEEALAEAGLYASEREAFQHGLVILAMGHPYWLTPSPSGWRLLVSPNILAHARFQLTCFDRESHGWPPAAPTMPRPRGKMDFQIPLLWALLTAGCYWAQTSSTLDLAALGCLDTQALFSRGELWRPLTALFLHADLAHLVANLFSGVFLFATLTTEFRVRQAWGLLFLASLCANLISATIHLGSDYRSLGASTAVFAALGLLTGRSMRGLLAGAGPRTWRPLIIPLAAGSGLLALFGTGGLQTDLSAHATGFLSGLTLGLLARLPSTAREGHLT